MAANQRNGAAMWQHRKASLKIWRVAKWQHQRIGITSISQLA